MDLTTERHVTEINWLRMQLAYPRIPIPSSIVEERTIEDHNTVYYLDLLNRGKHWRATERALLPVRSFLLKVEMPGASLSLPAQHLLAGDRNLPVFAADRTYDRYLTWLYQLRYAPH